MVDPVVVSGYAWSTALGSDRDEVWAALMAGRTGLVDTDSEQALRNRRAAVVPGLDLARPPRDRQQALSVDVAVRALAEAGLSPDDPGLLPVFGTSYGPHLDDPKTTSLSAWAVQAGQAIGLADRPVGVSTACSAGSDAVLTALELIRAGLTERCLCLGVDVLTPAKRLGHSLLGTMSATELRAFDRAGDGTLLGEGAAALVVESQAAAAGRGAPVRAVLAGAGSANDASGSAVPDPSGRALALAVQRALVSAGRSLGDVDVINAHGSGTPTNDVLEASGYRRIFAGQDRRPTLFTTKGSFGHTLGATGAIEAVALLESLRRQAVPAVHGLREPRPELDLPVPIGAGTAVEARFGLSVTLGFGGFITCLALAEEAR